MKRLVLWDIDGTLLWGGGVGGEAMRAAAAAAAVSEFRRRGEVIEGVVAVLDELDGLGADTVLLDLTDTEAVVKLLTS